VVVWRKWGGPRPADATAWEGFGSRLVSRSITDQLGGSVAFKWPPDGVVVPFRMSRARLDS
jgi:two-component sensor histidine kinase